MQLLAKFKKNSVHEVQSHSVNEPTIIVIFFPFLISRCLYFKALICINYNYFV